MVDAQDDQVAQPVEDVDDEAARVMTRPDHAVDDHEHVGCRTGTQRCHELVDEACVGQAQCSDGVGVGQALVAGAGQELTQDRQAVPDAACARPGNDGQRRLLGRDLLGLADHAQVVGQRPRWDQPEAVVEGPGADGRDDLVRLRRREDEAQVGRGLLHQLEEGVGSLIGQLVGLVDDVDLVSTRGRRVDRLLPQLPGVVDAPVRGGIEFHDVHRPGAVGRQLDAASALPARLRRWPLLAVE